MACLEIPPLQTGLPALLLREISDKDGNDYDKCDTYFRRPEPQELAHYNISIPLSDALIFRTPTGDITIIYSRGLYFYCNEHSIQSVHYLSMHSTQNHQTITIDNYSPRIWIYHNRPHLVVLQYKYACDMFYKTFRLEIYTITKGLQLAYDLTLEAKCDLYEYYFGSSDVLLYYNPFS